MSLIADAVAALTPSPTDEDRDAARAKACQVSTSGDWLSMILDHHVLLEGAFAKTTSAPDASSRTAAMKELGILLTGHAIAEENAIYPGMAAATSKGDANHAYTEQATVKMEMAKLEKLEPMSEDFLAKLEEIRVAVAHHMIEEEGDWYPELIRSMSAADQQMMSKNYAGAYTRLRRRRGARLTPRLFNVRFDGVLCPQATVDLPGPKPGKREPLLEWGQYCRPIHMRPALVGSIGDSRGRAQPAGGA